MKNIFSIISILALPCCPLLADTVSASDAERIAQRFFMETTGTKAIISDVKLVWDGRDDKTKTAPFYVFNSDAAFVVVAGDDRMEPILGYSTNGKFNPTDIPDGLKDLFNSYRRSITVVGNYSPVEATETANKWNKALTAAAPAPTTVVNLNTALWNQGSPYNLECPVVDDKRCITGCGATALAILMRYYQYPNRAYGTIPGYTTTQYSIELPSRTIDYDYQWDKMPLQYSSSSTTEQKNAVARLMADIGMMIQADYSPNNTWAYTNMILPAMLEHMKFSKNAQIKDRANFSTPDWVAMLKKELDAAHPIFYRGDSNVQGGHFYIIDGYDSNSRMHFNWGWGGSSNGFYYVPDTEFSSWENAIIGLVPDPDWTEPTTTATLGFLSSDSGVYGLWADTAYPEAGVQFILRTSLTNQGTGTYTGRIRMVQRHADKSETVLGMSGMFSLDSYYSISFGYYITLDTVSDGDELILYYLLDGKWVLVDDAAITVPLRYNIPDVLSMKYNIYRSDYKVLLIKGMTGMVLTCPDYPGGVTFSEPSIQLTNPTTGNYSFSNGHDTYSVQLSF